MAITDLTGTKWYFNEIISFPYEIRMSLTFISDNTTFGTIQYDGDGPLNRLMYYGNIDVWDKLRHWSYVGYRTIHITGGRDATNTQLIEFLQNNATQLPTDLTGTTWYFNESIDLLGEYREFAYNINYFIGNLPDEKTQLISEPNAFGPALWTNDDILIYEFEMGWRDESFRKIHITGGEDATNPELIQWLQDNAICVEYTPFKMSVNSSNIDKIIIKQNNVETFITKAYLGSNPNPVFEAEELHELGGKIFYVSTISIGATYKFYDDRYRELTNHTVVGLGSAKYYKISGTSAIDKFYILATDPNNDNHAVLKTGGVQWGAYGTLVGITTDGIGQGKPNTATALANPACFNDVYGGTNTIWTWIKDKRDNSLNGHNDWFILSAAELQQLYISGIERSYINNTIKGSKRNAFVWSSVENSNTIAISPLWSTGEMIANLKYSNNDSSGKWGCVAVRSI